jgi:GH43 family beta-xylosidase
MVCKSFVRRCSILYISAILLCTIALAATYTNPILTEQDPWVTYVNGFYYTSFTAYGCPGEHICVKAASTLTGLDSAPINDVWSAPSDPNAPNHAEVWAPEIHYLSGNWYIYYAADNGDNNNHRIFVLQAINPANPTGSYAEANTRLAHGQLYGSLGLWEIDPDVFTAADGNLYVTFSCTNGTTATQPQRICIASMSDPLTMSSVAVYLSTPDQPWERRSTANGIQEGPVGYARGNDTYITYSASASWQYNTYDVGVLAHFNDNGSNPSLLNGTWTKYGPILDNHGTAYGNGSIVFVPSMDGSEFWALYHSHDTGGALSTFMQQIFFTSYGWPVVGYPVNRGVALTDPAGEHGTPAGSYTLVDWGAAFGDAAEGNPQYGTIVGSWTLSTDLAYQATATSSTSGTWNQAFRLWNPNPQNFTVTAQAQWVSDTGNLADFPKYGLYCSYNDLNNHAEMFLDKYNKVLASHAVVNGTDQGWSNASLPSGFDFTQWHNLQCDKSSSTYTFTVDPGSSNVVTYSRTFNLANGQIGVITDDTQANFRNVSVNQYLNSK